MAVMLHKDMDLSRLMTYAQQIEADKIRERDRMRGSKRARSDQHEFSRPRLHTGMAPNFRDVRLFQFLLQLVLPRLEVCRSKGAGLSCLGRRTVLAPLSFLF